MMNGFETSSAVKYLEKWRLNRMGDPIITATGSLYPVQRDGQDLMLKILSQDSDEYDSCNALVHYGGCGAVAVFERADSAFLMSRAMPGTSLKDIRVAQDDAIATQITSQVLKKLHSVPMRRDAAQLPALQSLEASFQSARLLNDQRLPENLLLTAETQFHKLLGSCERTVVLHGDLHHENVLMDEAAGWVAIDPKGFLGDPAYDCAALLRNPPDDLEIATLPYISARVGIMTQVLDYPSDRIMRWALVHAVLSAIWSVEDDTNPELALSVASTLLHHLDV